MKAKTVYESIDDILKPKNQDDVLDSLKNLRQYQKDSLLFDKIVNHHRDDRNLDTIKLLLDAGADVNVMNTVNQPIIELAVQQRNLELVKLLLDRGANKYIWTTLQEALDMDFFDAVVLLRERYLELIKQRELKNKDYLK